MTMASIGERSWLNLADRAIEKAGEDGANCDSWVDGVLWAVDRMSKVERELSDRNSFLIDMETNLRELEAKIDAVICGKKGAQ